MCARANSSLEDREGSGGELVLFDLSNFILAAKLSVSRGLFSGAEGTYVNSDRGFERSSLQYVSTGMTIAMERHALNLCIDHFVDF